MTPKLGLAIWDSNMIVSRRVYIFSARLLLEGLGTLCAPTNQRTERILMGFFKFFFGWFSGKGGRTKKWCDTLWWTDWGGWRWWVEEERREEKAESEAQSDSRTRSCQIPNFSNLHVLLVDHFEPKKGRNVITASMIRQNAHHEESLGNMLDGYVVNARLGSIQCNRRPGHHTDT